MEEDAWQSLSKNSSKRKGAWKPFAKLAMPCPHDLIALNTGVELAFPTRLAEGLADASPENLADIEISPAGLGLHWPRLDADLYIPALLQGVFGSKSWMARQLGAEGGRSRTIAKTAASRENGRKGGRPRKIASA